MAVKDGPGVTKDGPGVTLATVTEYVVDGSLRNVLLHNDMQCSHPPREWILSLKFHDLDI